MTWDVEWKAPLVAFSQKINFFSQNKEIKVNRSFRELSPADGIETFT